VTTEACASRTRFCLALERASPQERAEYLDQACHGQPELRTRVEARLRANDEASRFSQAPANRAPPSMSH
jgi:serine/threonine-protein kinase